MSGVPPSATETPTAPIPERPPGLKGFLRGPRLVDRKGLWFIVVIFVLVAVVFAIAFYEFSITLQPIPTAPVQFSTA